MIGVDVNPIIPHTHNPLSVGQLAQNMAGKAEGVDAKGFQKIALISMGVMAAASAGSVLIALLHEINRKHEKEHDRCR